MKDRSALDLTAPVTLEIATLEPLLGDRFQEAGLGAEEAALIARALCDAEMCQVATHGLLRVPWYLAALGSGSVKPFTETPLLVDDAAVAVIDGRSAYGYLPSWRAVTLAADRARSFGIGIALVRNCAEFGRAAFYVAELAREGLVGIACQNTAPQIAAPDSKIAVIGNSPIGFAAPGPHGPSFDAAYTVRSGGELHRRRLLGLEVPQDWGYLDADGHPTSDPTTAIRTAQQAAGGMKGFGVALLVDLLAGALSGSEHGAVPLPGSPTLGATVLAVDPQRLGLDLDSFDAGYAGLQAAVQDAGGLWPGSRSKLNRAAAQDSGTVQVALGIVEACREALGEEFDAAVRS